MRRKTQAARRARMIRRFRRKRMPAVPLLKRRQPEPPKPVVVEKEIPVQPAPRPSPRRQILFCPGPVNTTPHVHAALGGPDLCHREPEFADMLQTIRAKLVHALGLDHRYSAVVISGSGTAALEAGLVASMDSGHNKLLVVNNGVYGSRIAQIARIHQIPVVEIRSPVTERPDLSRLSAALKRDRQIGTIAMVHHETSTGMLNPVEEVGLVAKKFRKRFFLDAISSIGGERLDLAKSGVAICAGSAGKCLHGAPGLSFVLIAQEEMSRVAKLKPRSLYLDLALHMKAQEEGEPPFTPAVPLVAAFHAALDELVREGVKNRVERYRERAVMLRTGFKKMGLKPVLDEKLQSNSLTALWVPPGKEYKTIHHALKKAGFIIYAGQSELKGKILRVAHMGQLLQSDLKDFLRALKEVSV